MSSVEKVSKFLCDRKEEVFTTPLLQKNNKKNMLTKALMKFADMPFWEKKSLTKDVEKSTDKLADVNKAVVIICKKGLYKFEGSV